MPVDWDVCLLSECVRMWSVCSLMMAIMQTCGMRSNENENENEDDAAALQSSSIKV